MDITGPTKDADSIKLFVGQIPRAYEAKEFQDLFAPYGEISELSIIRDRETRISKGCAFLSFVHRQSAVNCMASLHEKQTLPGLARPLQVKPADSELKAEERKLFVGMLSRTTNEDYLRQLFSQYGAVEDIAILRNPDGSSKGCGFIKLATRAEAQLAINSLNGVFTADGARSPMIVKFADTDREKAQKKQQMPGMLYGQGMPPMGMALGAPQLGSLTAQLMALQSMPGLQQQIAALQAQQLGMQQMPPAQAPPTQYGQPQYGQPQYGQPQQFTMAPMPQQFGQPDMSAAFGGVQQFAAGGYAQQPYQQQPVMSAAPPRAGQRQGPDGANLFICNLPQEYTDSSLGTLFMPFGNVVSAKVFIDKATNRSKEFGFVSFDNAGSASAAIASMNGYTLGHRPLKVSLKTQAGSANPY